LKCKYVPRITFDKTFNYSVEKLNFDMLFKLEKLHSGKLRLPARHMYLATPGPHRAPLRTFFSNARPHTNVPLLRISANLWHILEWLLAALRMLDEAKRNEMDGEFHRSSISRRVGAHIINRYDTPGSFVEGRFVEASYIWPKASEQSVTRFQIPH
jgi:hypothetical protein